MRSTLKRAAEFVLTRGGASVLGRHLHRADTIVLSYHNIVPDGTAPCGDRPLHLPRSTLAAQLDLLTRTHDVVPLDALCTKAERRTRRPRAAITFDDAYAGAMEIGLPELARRGLPATVFVAPAFVGGRTFWWDDFAAEKHGLSPAHRTHALLELQGRDARIREWLGELVNAKPESAAPPHARCATLIQLRTAAAIPGVTFGVHTWSHPNLAALSSVEIAAELQQPREWLQAHFANYVDWVAYPYGLTSAEAERIAASLGFRGGFLTSGGWLRPGHDEFSLPRMDIPSGASRNGFILRAAGVTGTRDGGSMRRR